MQRTLSNWARNAAVQRSNSLLESACIPLSRSVQTQFTAYDVGQATNIKWHESMVSRGDKETLLGQKGCVLWFTGLSGSGKSTVACTLEHALNARGKMTALLDGDNVRHGLNKNLGFTQADREENIRRIGEVSKLFADAGIITLVSFISPYLKDREAVRQRCPGDFVEVYMKIPIEVCEQRDPKGLYKKARAGQLKGFTGIDDPYEEPTNPELTITVKEQGGGMNSPESMAAQILHFLEAKGFLEA
jgi:adenylylsulfate kinase